MEQRLKLEWSTTVYNCDQCLLPLTPVGIVIDTDFRQYPHTCPNGHKQRLEFPYPRLHYRVVGDSKWIPYE